MNIAQHLEQTAQFLPDKTAIIFEDQSISYAQLEQKASQLASGLRKFGLQPGDRLAIFLPNTPEFVIAYFAAQKLGAIAVALNVLLIKNEVGYILQDSGARIIFAGKDQAGQIPVEELKNLERVVLTEGEETDDRHISKLYDQSVNTVKALEMEADDPAAILYTSGTTGFPKGATLTHQNVISNINATIYHAQISGEDILHLFLPLFHCFGQNFIMNSAVKRGATLVIHRRFEPDPVVQAIKKHKVTMFFAVPTIYIYLLNMKDEDLDLSSVRYFFTAAASMPQEVADSWQAKYHLPIHEGYGLTECSPFACYNHDFKHKPGAIGHPVIHCEIKIVNKQGNLAAPGEWGEICVKGPNVMKGYWNKPEETAKAIVNGWLLTGDVGTQDEDGDYAIVDRVKDMINSAGNNIYPSEIENHLYGHPAVREVAVFAMPDSIKGECVKAAIVLQPGANPSVEDIIGFCRTKMAKYKVPSQIVFVDSLPKSATGKLLKRVLRETA